jgi:PAS domain S-box-containing protein
MKIKTRLTIYLLSISLIPLLLLMASSLWYVSGQFEKLLIKSLEERVYRSAFILDSFFSERLAELQVYVETPLIQSMDWHAVSPFLRQEVDRHHGRYEKFIIGMLDSHFHNTIVGNPAAGGLASFNDKDPDAKLKSIRKRGYWRALVGTNDRAENRTHVSNPMISYTTGVKQIVVGASILSQDKKLVGMLGGAIQWEEIKSRINLIHDDVTKAFGEEAQLSLVDSEGIYIYHWNPEKVVHLALDDEGKPVLNDLGEKSVVLTRITEEDSPELSAIGAALVKGESGHSHYFSTDNNIEMETFYSPMKVAGYGLIMTLPKEVIHSSYRNMQYLFGLFILFTVIVIVGLSFVLAHYVISRIFEIHHAAQAIASGDYGFRIATKGNDEISALAETFSIVGEKVRHNIEALSQVRVEQERIARELTQLIDTANAPIFGIDAHGKVNEWNQQAEKITGFNKQEVMGRDLVADFITDDYKVSVGDVLARALAGKETANYEFPLFTQSGARVDVLLSSTTRRDASGQTIGVVGVGQDITELNQIRLEQESERKKASAQIIQSSKLATLGEMATSVAHELNQPLNIIRMAAGNSRRKISKGAADPKYLNDKLVRIEEQTERAAAIIDHMRMFGRQAKEKPAAVDPRKMVTNALGLMGEQLRLAGIEIVTELPEDCSLISGHPILIEQVLLNLITNARDAIAKKGGESKITLRVIEDDEGVHITSEDTGGGIPEDVLPRIFEPFYTTKEIGKGTGLGLSVSYGIIRDMNGTIVAENINDGAQFTITFPDVSEYGITQTTT